MGDNILWFLTGAYVGFTAAAILVFIDDLIADKDDIGYSGLLTDDD